MARRWRWTGGGQEGEGMLRYEFTQTFLSMAQVIQFYGNTFIVTLAAVIVGFILCVVIWSWLSDRMRKRAREKDEVEEVTLEVLQLKATLWQRDQTLDALRSELRRARAQMSKARQLGDLVGRIGA